MSCVTLLKLGQVLHSVLSLQGLDRLGFIAVVLANGGDAVVEASKLELLMQLDCELVNLNLVEFGLEGFAGRSLDNWAGVLSDTLTNALDLDRDRGAHGVALVVSEDDEHFVDLVVAGNNVLLHLEENSEDGRFLAADLLEDGHAHGVERHLSLSLLVSEGDSVARSFPGPVGIVHDLDLCVTRSARSNDDWIFGLALADCAIGQITRSLLFAIWALWGRHCVLRLSKLLELDFPVLDGRAKALTELLVHEPK